MAKQLQLLRNQTAFTDKATALTNLKAKLVDAETKLAAGEPLIASYNETDRKIGILLAISYGDNTNYQIFEGSKLKEDGTLEIPQEVQDAINEAVAGVIGGASEGYDTLGEIETLIKGLQTEIDTTQKGAGLGTDGTYTAKGDANYINGATSLKSADEALDAAIKAVDNKVVAEVGKAYLDGVVAGNGIAVTEKASNKQTISAKAVDSDPIIEVTGNGIGTKTNAVWDCGTY